MKTVNNLINKNPIHFTTNTILLIVIAIIAFYILLKAAAAIIKIIAVIGICWFVLMSVQSTNLVNIPIIKQTYNVVEKMIPSKELWTKATNYLDDGVKKVSKVYQDAKSSK